MLSCRPVKKRKLTGSPDAPAGRGQSGSARSPGVRMLRSTMQTRNSSHSERSWSTRNGVDAAGSTSGSSSNYSTPPPTLDAEHSRSVSHLEDDENHADDSPILVPMISQNGISKPRRGPGRPKRGGLRAS